MQNPYHLLKKLAPHCITKIIVEAADPSNVTQLNLINRASYDALFTLPVVTYSPLNPGKLHFLRGKKCLADYQYNVNENILIAYWFFLQAYDAGYADGELALDNFEQLITMNMSMPSQGPTYFMRALETLMLDLLKKPGLTAKTQVLLHYLLGTMAAYYCLMLKEQLQHEQLSPIVRQQLSADSHAYACKAETFLSTAMARGFAKASYRLHELYLNLDQAEKARQLVTYLLARAAQPEAYYYLGEIYWQKWVAMDEQATGPELASNLAAAMLHFAKAADAGHLSAQTKVILFTTGFRDCLQEPAYQPIVVQLQAYISRYQSYQLNLQQCCAEGNLQAQYEQTLIELYGNTFTDALAWQRVIDGLMPLAQKNHLGALQQLMQLAQQSTDTFISPYIDQSIDRIYEFCLSKLAKNGLFHYQIELAEKLSNQQFHQLDLLVEDQQSASFWQQKALFSMQKTDATSEPTSNHQPSLTSLC